MLPMHTNKILVNTLAGISLGLFCVKCKMSWVSRINFDHIMDNTVSLIHPDMLRQLIGRNLTYQGITCRVIEILAEGPQLVLQDCNEGKVIQTNQYGEANRRVPRVFTVPLLNPRRDGLNPALPELARWLS